MSFWSLLSITFFISEERDNHWIVWLEWYVSDYFMQSHILCHAFVELLYWKQLAKQLFWCTCNSISNFLLHVAWPLFKDYHRHDTFLGFRINLSELSTCNIYRTVLFNSFQTVDEYTHHSFPSPRFKDQSTSIIIRQMEDLFQLFPFRYCKLQRVFIV